MAITTGITGVTPDVASLKYEGVTRTSGMVTREKDVAATKKAAKEFEALFIGMMLKSMRETVGKDPLIEGGRGEDVYRSLLDQEYATAMAAQGGIGLAAMLEHQLIKSSDNRGAGQTGISHDKEHPLNNSGANNEN